MRSLVVLVLGYVVAMRIAELALSRRNERSFVARGARRITPDGFAAIAAVHALWLAGIVVEELALGPTLAESSGLVGPAAAVAIASEVVRLACVASLGSFWNVRVVVLPGVALVRRGPYRWFRHPNYAAVVVQLVALPLALGLPWTAGAVLVPKLLALRPRLRAEEAALGIAGAAPHPTPPREDPSRSRS